MAFAREIFQKIKENIKFQQANKESDSHYTVLGNTLVRISNHCTYMYVWDNYFQENPKHEKMNILSIVFEDKSDTFNTNCSVLKHNKDRQIVVDEYVYPLHGNPQFLSKSDIKAIIRSLQNMMTTNRYDEPTGKAIYNKRKSINPTSQNISANGDSYEYTPEFSRGIDYVSESKNNKNKQDKNMKTENRKRNVVRLTESQLKQMIAESVKKVLNESDDVKRQWESEKRAFFRGLKSGKAYVDGDTVYVEIGPHNERDPRYVYFRFGGNNLMDDNLYVQSSPALSISSIRNIYQILDSVYGEDVSEYLYDEND